MQPYLPVIFLTTALCALSRLHPFSPRFLRNVIPNRRIIILNLENSINPRDANLRRQRNQADLAYIQRILGVDEHTATCKLSRYNEKWGSVLNGLVMDERIYPKDYEEFVIEHIDYQGGVRPNKVFTDMLKSMDANIVIFTSVGSKHAEKMLTRMELMPFVHVIFASVPGEIESSQEIMGGMGAFARIKPFLKTNSNLISYVDDSKYYLDTAKDFDWNRIHVDWSLHSHLRHFYPTIDTIYHLPQVLKGSTITPEKE